MDSMISEMIQELKDNSNPSYQKNFQRFFLEPIPSWGVPKSTVREIGARYFKRVMRLSASKPEIFAHCQELLAQNQMELSVVALQWAHRLKNYYDHADIIIFERWLGSYITNWALCDDFCAGALGSFFIRYPDLMGNMQQWSKDRNRWVRRASAVTLIYCARKQQHVEMILQRALDLMQDPDHYVQKGYGWLLKKTSAQAEREVFDFVMKYKSVMPRMALRYAIEKLPHNLRQQALIKS